MPDPDRPRFGDLDGEPIDLVSVKVSGTAGFARVVQEGETVLLVVEATAGLPTLKRVDGRLVRIHPLKVVGAAEPTDRLADEAETFLQAFVDELNGVTRLPFDPETGEVLETEEDADDDEEA